MKNSLSILAIMILAAVITAFTGSFTITGKVTDSSGQPLAGVNVIEKGSSNGIITDLNGNYKITVSDKAKILVFSFIGCTTVEQQIAGRLVINVKMNEAEDALQEVVVLGYGSKKDKSAARGCSL
jgi:hypothetical protein